MTRMYEKPQAIVMVENHEGVYMASGAGNGGAKWYVSAVDRQMSNNAHKFQIECTLDSGVSVDVSNLRVELQFNNPVQSASVEGNEFSCSILGQTVILTLNNGMNCGPGYKLYPNISVVSSDAVMTAGLAVTSCSAS